MEYTYKPSEDFVVNGLESLDDLDLTPSEEIWLITYPLGRGSSSQLSGIEGDVLKIENRDKNGSIGVAKDSSGNKYDMVSYIPQEADAAVIVASEKSSLVANISRRVSLVRYAEPNELLQTMKARTQQKLVGAVTNSSGKYSNPSQSSRHKSGLSSARPSASARSSKKKSVPSSITETPKSPKRKHSSKSSSGKHLSSTSTVSGSSERSGKKRKTKKEE